MKNELELINKLDVYLSLNNAVVKETTSRLTRIWVTTGKVPVSHKVNDYVKLNINKKRVKKLLTLLTNTYPQGNAIENIYICKKILNKEFKISVSEKLHKPIKNKHVCGDVDNVADENSSLEKRMVDIYVTGRLGEGSMTSKIVDHGAEYNVIGVKYVKLNINKKRVAYMLTRLMYKRDEKELDVKDVYFDESYLNRKFKTALGLYRHKPIKNNHILKDWVDALNKSCVKDTTNWVVGGLETTPFIDYDCLSSYTANIKLSEASPLFIRPKSTDRMVMNCSQFGPGSGDAKAIKQHDDIFSDSDKLLLQNALKRMHDNFKPSVPVMYTNHLMQIVPKFEKNAELTFEQKNLKLAKLKKLFEDKINLGLVKANVQLASYHLTTALLTIREDSIYLKIVLKRGRDLFTFIISNPDDRLLEPSDIEEILESIPNGTKFYKLVEIDQMGKDNKRQRTVIEKIDPKLFNSNIPLHIYKNSNLDTPFLDENSLDFLDHHVTRRLNERKVDTIVFLLKKFFTVEGVDIIDITTKMVLAENTPKDKTGFMRLKHKDRPNGTEYVVFYKGKPFMVNDFFMLKLNSFDSYLEDLVLCSSYPNESDLLNFVGVDENTTAEDIKDGVKEALEIFGNTVSITDLSHCINTPLTDIISSDKKTENKHKNLFENSAVFVGNKCQFVNITDTIELRKHIDSFKYLELAFDVTSDVYKANYDVLRKFIFSIHNVEIEDSYIFITEGFYNNLISQSNLFLGIEFTNVNIETFYRQKMIINNLLSSKLANYSRPNGIKLGTISDLKISKGGVTHSSLENITLDTRSIKGSIKDILVNYGIDVTNMISGSMYNSFLLELRKLKDGVVDGFFNIRFGEPGSINCNEFSVVILYKGNQPILDNNLAKMLAKDIRLVNPRFEFITHKPE